MNLRYVLLGSILILAALSGCTGGGGDGDTTTPATAAPATTAAPVTTAPAVEAALHGVGKCDTCHAAPTVDDIRTKHKIAFEKMEGHKDMCAGCHEVETTCTKCHALPSIMAPADDAPVDADEGS